MKLVTESRNTLTLNASDLLNAIRRHAEKTLGAGLPIDLAFDTPIPGDVVVVWTSTQTLPMDDRPSFPSPLAKAGF